MLAVGLLFGYWALLTLVPVPGFGPGDLSPEGNLGAYLDRMILGDRLWERIWDPEGLLSTLPAVATTLLGIFTGEWLRSDDRTMPKTVGLLVGGLVAMGLGLWGLSFPSTRRSGPAPMSCSRLGRAGSPGRLLLAMEVKKWPRLGATLRGLRDECHRRFRCVGPGGEANGADPG